MESNEQFAVEVDRALANHVREKVRLLGISSVDQF